VIEKMREKSKARALKGMAKLKKQAKKLHEHVKKTYKKP
jgi:hypothetical protein